MSRDHALNLEVHGISCCANLQSGSSHPGLTVLAAAPTAEITTGALGGGGGSAAAATVDVVVVVAKGEARFLVIRGDAGSRSDAEFTRGIDNGATITVGSTGAKTTAGTTVATTTAGTTGAATTAGTSGAATTTAPNVPNVSRTCPLLITAA